MRHPSGLGVQPVSGQTRLEDRYFRRMASSIGDKARMMAWVRAGHVVDIGAGGGELSRVLVQHPELRVTAVDSSKDALKRLARIDGVDAFRGRFGGDMPLLDEPADTVIASAVMHEVFSYGSGWSSVRAAIGEARLMLRPGGRFIVRDGVMPPDFDAPARFVAPDAALVRRYLDLSPHECTSLQQDGAWWTGSRHAVSEALLTLTWGGESLPREALERYELATLESYPAEVVPLGFRLVHAESYVQPGYERALAHYRVESLGEPWFPPTNALWVYDRL